MSTSRTLMTSGGYFEVEAPQARLDSRVRHRSNVFVAAALDSDFGSGPAMVRNLSEVGALVEGPILPPPGTRVRLRRGVLEVAGTLVWQNGRRAGLKFDSSIAVDDWLPSSSRKHQALVDEAVHNIRTSALDVHKPAASAGQPGWNAEKIASLVQRVAEGLSADGRIVSEYSEALQQLEMAVQHLRRLP